MSKVNLLPENAIKFRETSADSVVYHLQDHSPELPRTLTVSRVLPLPRKGNAGTCKIFVNVRITSDIGTTDAPKIVPTIVKLETSCPVGSHINYLYSAFKALEGLSAVTFIGANAISDRQDLFLAGYLLDNTGSPLSESFTA